MRFSLVQRSIDSPQQFVYVEIVLKSKRISIKEWNIFHLEIFFYSFECWILIFFSSWMLLTLLMLIHFIRRIVASIFAARTTSSEILKHIKAIKHLKFPRKHQRRAFFSRIFLLCKWCDNFNKFCKDVLEMAKRQPDFRIYEKCLLNHLEGKLNAFHLKMFFSFSFFSPFLLHWELLHTAKVFRMFDF